MAPVWDSTTSSRKKKMPLISSNKAYKTNMWIIVSTATAHVAQYTVFVNKVTSEYIHLSHCMTAFKLKYVAEKLEY